MIYRAEAEYLLSDQRKQQLADIYLEFADTYFKPPKEEQKPDYAKALEFYKKGLEAGAKPETQAEVELRIGECLQNLNSFGEAAAQFEKFIKDHPEKLHWTLKPATVSASADCPKAISARRGEVWQDLLAKYIDKPQSPRLADAQFDLSRTWNILNPQNDEQLNLGTAALRTFLERFPTHKNAGQAHLQIAQSYLNRGRAADAVAALKQFLSDAHCRDCKELPDGQNLLGVAYRAQKEFTGALAAGANSWPNIRPTVRGAPCSSRSSRPNTPWRPNNLPPEIRRGQQALRRVPGQVSVGPAEPADHAPDEPAERGRRKMGRRHIRLAEAGIEVSWHRAPRRWPNSSSLRRSNENSASSKKP